MAAVGIIFGRNLWQRPFRDINQFVKRGEDVVLASLALALFAPIAGLAALLVRVTSPGPIFFVQPRVGFNNEVIHVLKFRTMYEGASESAHRAYIEGLGWENWDPREFLEGMSRATGQRLGVAFAAPFEVFPMGWGE